VSKTIEWLLQQPAFYVKESGSPGSFGALDAYALASRLSYFLTGSTPDAELLAAAAAGELATPAQIEQQVLRLLATPRAHEMVRNFLGQWLRLEGAVDKDPALYPQYGSLQADMVNETLTFGEHVVFEEGYPRLLQNQATYVNEPLARFYGIQGVTGAGFRRVTLDTALQRAGLLTQASILAANSHADSTSPVRRGLFVLRQLLCVTIPPPPVDVPPLQPARPGLTMRQRMQQHSQTACAGCHHMIDGLGFGLEHFDAIGRYRTSEDGVPIDATGTVTLRDAQLSFDGALELSKLLATSADVPDCIAVQFFRFALQRYEEAGEVPCSLLRAQLALRSGATFRDMFVAIATSDSFRYARW